MNAIQASKINPWREISIVMLILMEACWVTPWFRSLTAETYAINPWRVFAVIIMMVLFAHFLVRIMDALRLRKTIRQVLMVGFIVIGILVGIKILLYAQQPTSLAEFVNRPLKNFGDLKYIIPPEFIVIIVVLVTFWRGLSLAQEHIGPSAVMDHFWLGIIMYVVFIFANTLVTGETPGDFFFLFLFAGLVAMCTSRLTVIGMLRGGRQNKFNRFWLMGIILTASLVVALSALLGGMVGNQFGFISTLIFGIFGSILVLLFLIISPLISLVIKVLAEIFNSQAMQSLADSLQNLDRIIQGFGRNIFDTLGQSAFSRFISRWAPTLKTVIFVGIIVVLFVGVIAWMAIRLWQDRVRRQSGGEQKSGLIMENILQSILNMLRQGWGGMVNRLTQVTDFNRRQKIRAAARIRQVYAELMELCASLGHPRADAETPLEYLPKLIQIFPGLQLEASVITDAYNYVRYGQLPETRQEVDEVEAAWERLHAAGRELSAAQRHLKNK